MIEKKEFDEQSYECGGCRYEVTYLRGQKRPQSCPKCGWVHGTMKSTDVPSEMKLSLGEYGG